MPSAAVPSAFDLEILSADAPPIWLGFMLAKPEGWQTGDPIGLSDALSAQASDQQLSEDLQPQVTEDWSGGVGIAYDGAYAVYTRTPGYACPAGLGVQQSPPVGNALSPIVAWAEYGGDLYYAIEGTAAQAGRVVRIPAGTASVPLQVNSLASLPAGSYMRDLLVADDGSGNNVLFATTSDSNGTGGRLHRLSGGAWTSTTNGTEWPNTRGLGRMASVYWRTEDGNGDWRIVTITGPKTIAYTFPNVNPMGDGTLNSMVNRWSPDIKIGTQGRLREIIAFRRHAFFGADDDVYDLNELGESQALTDYLRKMTLSGLAGPSGYALQTGYAVAHLNGYIYVSAGRGLIRLYVGDPGQLQETPIEGQCAPGWATATEGRFRGYVTAMCVDQGYLAASVYDPTAQKSSIFWGIDRRIVGVQTPNPLVWYGPEVTIDYDYRVTRMITSTVTGSLCLWIGLASVVGNPLIYTVSLPIAGSPIQDLASPSSGGASAHKFALGSNPGQQIQTSCRLEMLADSWEDKATRKHVFQVSVGSRGLSQVVDDAGAVLSDDGLGTHLKLWSRADPPPGYQSWNDEGDVLGGPNVDRTLPIAISGHKTQLRVDFSSPSGAAASPKPAILDSLRTLAWKVAPSLRVVTLPIEYGDGVYDNDGLEDDQLSVDDKTAKLKRLSESGPTQMRDRQGMLWSVKVRQVLDGTETLVDGGTWGKRARRGLHCTILSGPTP
jgi:hypothetical protein